LGAALMASVPATAQTTDHPPQAADIVAQLQAAGLACQLNSRGNYSCASWSGENSSVSAEIVVYGRLAIGLSAIRRGLAVPPPPDDGLIGIAKLQFDGSDKTRALQWLERCTTPGDSKQVEFLRTGHARYSCSGQLEDQRFAIFW